MESTQQDEDIVVQAQLAVKQKYVLQLENLFQDLDSDSTGKITLRKFESRLQDSRLKAYLDALDLTTEEAWSLFKLLDTQGTRMIDVDDFVSGCLKLRGTARSLDIHMLMYESRWTMNKLTKIMKVVQDLSSSLCEVQKQLPSTLPPQAANAAFLCRLCGPGDFLCAARRASVVREAAAATATCPACLELAAQGKAAKGPKLFERVGALDHTYAEPDECGGLGALVHSLANAQHLLDAEWHAAAVAHLWEVLRAAGELPAAALERPGQDEGMARLVELVACVAGAVGLRAFYRSLGKGGVPSLPEVPAKDDAGKPRFSAVTDFSSRLDLDLSTAWGPWLRKDDAKLDVLADVGLTGDSVGNTPWRPVSKWTPAPLTASSFFDWMGAVYVPLPLFTTLFSPFENRVLARVDMETVAAAYTGTMKCSF